MKNYNIFVRKQLNSVALLPVFLINQLIDKLIINFYIFSDPQQGHYQCPESGFSKCVNSFFQWGSALVATAATAVSTLKESTTSLTSTLNPDLGSSGGVNPGDHPGVGYPEVHPVSTATSLASSLNPNAQEFTPAKPPAESPSGALAGSTGSIAGSTGSAHGVGVYPEVPVVKSGELINAKDIHSAEKSIKIVPDELQNHENSEISTNCNNKTSLLEKQINTVSYLCMHFLKYLYNSI